MARAVAVVGAVAAVVAGRKMGASPLSRVLNRKMVQTQTPQLTLHPLMPVQRMRRSGPVVAHQRHRPPKLLKLQLLSPRAWMKSQNACAAKRQMTPSTHRPRLKQQRLWRAISLRQSQSVPARKRRMPLPQRP
jgi:hypothetical protein